LEESQEARGRGAAGLSREPPPGEFASRRALWLYWAVVAFLFGAGAFERFTLPATPFSDPDTWGYLYPALSGLTRGVFVHTYGRTFVYPLFVYGILGGFHDFVYVSAFQHLLGLLSGVLLLASWRGLSPLLPDCALVRSWHRYLGLLALAVFLLSKTSLLMEHSIRPEAVFPFFAILCLWLALRTWRAFQKGGNPKSAFFWGIALVYDSILLYFIKPSWGFGVFFSMAPLLVSLFQLKGRPGYKVLVLLVPALLAYVTLFVPERRLVREYDPGSDRFLPSLLLSVHADIIRDEMARDLGSVPADERALLGKLIPLIDAEIKANASNNSKLAINPDVFLYHKDSVCALVGQFFGKDIEGYRDFCFSYYKKAWLHQPGRMLRKVLRQLHAFYSWENQGYDASIHAVISTKETAVRTENALNNLPVALPAYDNYRNVSLNLEQTRGGWRQPMPISLLNMLLYVCYPLVVLGSLLVCGAVLWKPASWSGLVPLALWTLYFHSYNFGNCLTIAVVHNMQVGRYVKNQLIFTVFSECCGVLLIVAAVRALISGPDVSRSTRPVD